MDSEVKRTFEQDGLLVLRDIIPQQDAAAWRDAWEDFYDAQFQFGRQPNWNPVDISGPFPDELSSMYRHPVILDIAEQVFGPDIALYNHRFVVKDSAAPNPVFLHHDTPYHFGWPRKASFFVPLSPCNVENGCLVFYPGTHKFGYLGDAGEINREFLEVSAVYPQVDLGDLVVMHSALWHESFAKTGGDNRVLADIILQPADDPSGIELLRGLWRTEARISKEMRERAFVRSRVSKIQELTRASAGSRP